MQKERERFIAGAVQAGHRREAGRRDLRSDGDLRHVRLQQVALRGVRAGLLPDRLPEGALPGRVHGRAAVDGDGRHRQDVQEHRRVPRARHPHPAARRQREPRGLHRARARRRQRSARRSASASAPCAASAARRSRTILAARDAAARSPASPTSASACLDQVAMEPPTRPGQRRPPRRWQRAAWRRARTARPDVRTAATATQAPAQVNKKVIESLIKCGAFDFTGATPPPAVRGARQGAADGRAAHAKEDANQIGLFASKGINGRAPEPALPRVPPWPDKEMLKAEREALGFYITAHPLDKYESDLQALHHRRPASSCRTKAIRAR